MVKNISGISLTGLFSRLAPATIAVIGDFMLDTYTVGKARRISPEAPVAIVNVSSEEHRAGGAGNVVLNLLSMGATVIAIGRVGNDAAGELVQGIFAKEGISTTGFFIQPGYQTPVKNRIIAENQQIVRIDHETNLPICEMLEQKVIDTLPQLLSGVKVIAISDYDKGFLSRTLLAAIIDYAKTNGILVITDPKGLDFTKYSGTTIIKPNLSEVYAAANLSREAPLEKAAAHVLAAANAEIVMVTRSEAGISLFYPEFEQHDFPVRIHEIKDVTGAGDTVLAMLARALASGLDAKEAAPLCNVAASIAIERFGCARITLSDLAGKMLELDRGNKVFDHEHIFALQQLLKGKRPIALELQESGELTTATYQTILQHSGQSESPLLIYVTAGNASSELISILKELRAVDFIIVGDFGFESLCQTLGIEEAYAVM